MEDLIKQAFLHVEVIGPLVQEGRYDLIGPNGEIILPAVWERVVEPDWAITMHMWPIAPQMPSGIRATAKPPPPLQGHSHPQQQPRPYPMGFHPASVRLGGGGGGGIMPPLPSGDLDEQTGIASQPKDGNRELNNLGTGTRKNSDKKSMKRKEKEVELGASSDNE